jgi:hypothetical protein
VAPAKRRKTPMKTDAPLEIALALNVSQCGTCAFFWPPRPTDQPYGPYTAYTAPPAAAQGNDPAPNVDTFEWIEAVSTAASFPDPAILAGCRKAPIMTVGINPNLTAVAPGRTGAAWAYPSFLGRDADQFARYAAYYRYRTVFQERLDLDAIRDFLDPDSHVVAPRPGVVTDRTQRTSSSASYDLVVRYDGDNHDTTIPLHGAPGGAQWVLLFDVHGRRSHFKTGDTLAAKLLFPPGETVDVHRQRVGYYEQFVPVLRSFDTFLRTKGFKGEPLRMGEDVSQIDMVACASPRWTPDYLGGTAASEATVIHNCVQDNGWAISQIVQSQPAVIYLVGQSSYTMFDQAFGAHITRTPPLPHDPADGAFTLMRATTDPDHPCHLEFTTTIDGIRYELRSRLVVSPHFSYPTNFVPQIRLAKSTWADLEKSHADAVTLLEHDQRVSLTVPDNPHQYVVMSLTHPDQMLAAVRHIDAPAAAILQAGYYNPHHLLATVLEDLYAHGRLTHTTTGDRQVLTRSQGGCQFCVNDHWTFPQGCPYGKPEESQPPAGYLAAVTKRLMATGKPHTAAELTGPINAPTRLTLAPSPHRGPR